MAWNGRNESILGVKVEVKDAAPPAPPKEAPEAATKTSNEQDASDARKKSPPAPAPILPSVWNGQHKKIMGNKEAASGSDTCSIVSSIPGLTRSPSPAISSASSTSKNKELKELVVTSPPKEDAKSTPKEKEDETTNSTAGSSITKSIDNEDPGNVEVKVVTTKVVTTTTVSADSDKKKSKQKSQSWGKLSEAAATAAADPALRKSSSGASLTNNRQNNQNAKIKSNNNSNHVRRSGNNNKGGARGNNNNNGNNNSGKNNNRQNYSRGGGSSGSGRRRANNNNNADKPLCSFFPRGMCNRGTSCAFKHDPAHIPPASSVTASSSNSPFQRSGTYPQAKNGIRPAALFASTKRVFDPHKALAIKLAKEAQDKEDRSSFASPIAKVDSNIIKDEKKTEDLQALVIDPPFFSIDVECIATGYGSCAKGINDGCGNAGREKEGVPSGQYNDRSQRYPGRIAVVDSDGTILANILVHPPHDGAGVVSYLTPLTGLTAELCLGEDAKPLDEAVEIVKGLLPRNAVLVGQAIDHDVEWLGLVPGRDFGRMVDISEIFRQRMPSVLSQAATVLKERNVEERAFSDKDPSSDAYLGFATRYRHFSLRHVCVNLLNEVIQDGVHDPVVDARYSLLLFHKYRNSSVTQLRIVRDGLHRAPITPSFASRGTPVVDGVCVSVAAYPYKRAARKIWKWYEARKKMIKHQEG